MFDEPISEIEYEPFLPCLSNDWQRAWYAYEKPIKKGNTIAANVTNEDRKGSG